MLMTHFLASMSSQRKPASSESRAPVNIAAIIIYGVPIGLLALLLILNLVVDIYFNNFFIWFVVKYVTCLGSSPLILTPSAGLMGM